MLSQRFVIAALVLALVLALALTANAAEESGTQESRSAAERAGEGSISAKDNGPTIGADQLSKPPKLTKAAKIDYPKEALAKEGGEVEVTLLVDLDDKGTVVGAAVLEPKTPTGLGFEDAALTAAYDLGFEPAEVAGKPASVQIVYKFKFVPPKPPAPEPVKAIAVEKPKPAPVENFTGELRERGTRNPLAGTLVTVYRNDGEVPVGFENITDAKGLFHFFDLEPGTWKVRIEPSSYYPFRTTEDIHPQERTQATYYIEKGSYNPFDVLVESKRERKEVTRVVIESAVIDKMPGAMGDPLAVIQNFAGVARAQAFSGDIIVRGSAPSDTSIYVDGTQVPLVYHFGGIRSVLPVGVIDSLEFYPGNFSPYYGNATAGVIDVTTKKLKAKKLSGYVDMNLLDSGLYLEIPIGEKATVAVSARRSYIDYIVNALVPSTASITSLTLPRYYDYQLLANYRPTAAHDLRLFVFGSDDRFEIITRNGAVAGSQLSGNEVLYATSFWRALGTYKYIPSESFENTLRLSQGRDTQDKQVFNITQNYTIDQTNLRDTLRYSWSKKLSAMGGLDLLYRRLNALFDSPTSDGDVTKMLHEQISGRNYLVTGIFAELELKPTKALLLLPGVRLDYYSSTSQFTAAPRFTARYELSKQLTLKGGVGLFYQEPTIEESDKVFGTATLKCQRAIHYSAGTEWRPLPHITLDATGFYKDLSSLVSQTQGYINGDGSADHYDNNGKGRVYGLELVAKHELTSKFTGWLAYTLSRSERRDSGTSSYHLFEYDQTHILTIFGTYQLPRNWQIGTRFRYVTGDPSTPVVGSVFNASKESYDPVNGDKYSTRVGAFHQLDIRLDKRWIYNSWMLTAYVDLQNVYNRTNPESIEYNYNYKKTQYSSGLPIYPILGVRGEF